MRGRRRPLSFVPFLASLVLHASALGAAAALWSLEIRRPSLGAPLAITVRPEAETLPAEAPAPRAPAPVEPMVFDEPDRAVPEDRPEPPPEERLEVVEAPPFVLTATHLASVAPREAPEEEPEATTAEPLAGLCAPPRYPWEAVRRGEEGIVWLRIRVGADGAILDVVLERSSGSARLDEAALAAVARWRFAPATVAGLPVEGEARLPIRFVLE